MQDIATQYKKRKAWMWFLLSLRHLLWPVRLKRVRLRICLFLPIRNGWIMRLIKAIDTASRQTLLGNSLVVVAPKASEQKDFTIDSKTNWTSLLNGGRLAVGDPEHVPAGIYAKEALQKLGAWDTLSRNWLRRKMFVARWRWSNAMKRRWVLFTVLTQLPAKGKSGCHLPGRFT